MIQLALHGAKEEIVGLVFSFGSCGGPFPVAYLHGSERALPDVTIIRQDVHTSTVSANKKQRREQVKTGGVRPEDPVVHLRVEVGILESEQMARVVCLFEVAEDARRFPHMDGGLSVWAIVDQSGHLGCVKGRARSKSERRLASDGSKPASKEGRGIRASRDSQLGLI